MKDPLPPSPLLLHLLIHFSVTYRQKLRSTLMQLLQQPAIPSSNSLYLSFICLSTTTTQCSLLHNSKGTCRSIARWSLHNSMTIKCEICVNKRKTPPPHQQSRTIRNSGLHLETSETENTKHDHLISNGRPRLIDCQRRTYCSVRTTRKI